MPYCRNKMDNQRKIKILDKIKKSAVLSATRGKDINMKFTIERTLNGFDIIEEQSTVLNRYDVPEEELSKVIKEIFEEMFNNIPEGAVTFKFA